MTQEELSQLYYLKREIDTDEQRLRELRRQAQSLPSPSLSGMPKGKTDGNRIERARERIERQEQLIAEKKARKEAERERLLRYIEDIPDSQIRQILKLRFVDLKSWSAVALGVGGNNTADSVRMACKRYLRKI